MSDKNGKKITIHEARQRGFVVDESCYPHVGYVGSRLEPTSAIEVFTQLEGELKTEILALQTKVKDLELSLHIAKDDDAPF